jgi:hypothetical protein
MTLGRLLSEAVMKPIPGANRCRLRRLAASSAFALALTLPLARMSLSMTIGPGTRSADKRPKAQRPDVAAGPGVPGRRAPVTDALIVRRHRCGSIGQLADAAIR